MITGFLHPGEMGSSVAAACAGRRIWASEHRSEATAARAEAAGIEDVGDVRTLVETADTIVSVCPPEAALVQARQVADLGFTGVYVDANAVSPATAKRVASMFENAVDGGIVGPPAVTSGTTRACTCPGRTWPMSPGVGKDLCSTRESSAPSRARRRPSRCVTRRGPRAPRRCCSRCSRSRPSRASTPISSRNGASHNPTS